LVDALQRLIEGLAVGRLTLGVTGFSRAGKTVFIGALAQALLTADAWTARRGQGPLAGFGPFERRQLRSARIRNDMHTMLPQFPYRRVRDSLLGQSAHWPQPTEGISRLVLELDALPESRLKRWLARQNLGRGRLQIEIVDYPGEWLIDLPMLNQSYEDWSERMWKLANSDARVSLSEAYRRQVAGLESQGEIDEEQVTELAESWTRYLIQAAEKGLTLNQPGRLLRPDKLRDSPVLRFAPLPAESASPALRAYMAKRFEQYKKQVIKPFYRNHFARIDRQIVLVDVVRALEQGEAVFDEMTRALEETLQSFNYGKGGLLSWLTRARTSKVLFAATKADHVTRGDRANLENMLRWMLALVDDHNRLRATAARVGTMALASVRATEDYMTDQPPRREILFGRPAGEPGPDQWDPGGLPLDMPPDWNAIHFQFMDFEPPVTSNALLEGFPAINLGKALDFLISEDLS
jgi:uncharacterized protein